MVYRELTSEWDLVDTLASEKNFEKLEWMICLLTTIDPYSVENVIPIAQTYAFEQDEYPHLVTFLVNLCASDDEEDLHDFTDGTHGFIENDFIYLDNDEDRGLDLGLSIHLYNILFP
ncbi:hypothetical protein [Enterobacter cloacae complex sp. GF14B]|uniref:hypothetical protein n=1 Tax=Enterobacter cloacae complex sp. GF14B TaxID=2511982 RepID=UPI00100FF377|nr:hypothetical protein [Enterobacter cloacae complex sp. GF14B]RYA37795.1 hypothetical protein DD606_26190 [Enterobacter cloacae complex sp. GF14B]